MRWTTTSIALGFLLLTSCIEADPPPPRLTDMSMDMVNPPGNTRPVASPGMSQMVRVGSTVTLDGSQSFDTDGDALTYQWILSAPEGSAAKLSDASAMITKFDADVAGDYVVTLVVNDSKIDSAASSVRIIAAEEMVDMNKAPAADAGLDRAVETGDTVTLDGSKSSDPDSDPLMYAWTLVTKPSGSTATLMGGTSPMPTFVADRDGTYEASLVVRDGKASSNPSKVTITASTTPPPNQTPVAKAGPNQTVEIGAMVSLDGSSSGDPDGEAITYAWKFESTPSGSTVSFDDATAQRPKFTVDLEGIYEISLTVSDDEVSSVPDFVTVVASDSNRAPVVNAGSDQSTFAGSQVTLDGSASTDPDGDTLTYAWTLMAPAGSSAMLSDATAAMPTFTPDVAGMYTATLVVSDGKVMSAPASVSIQALSACVRISEYVEGSSNNKALELYNCSGGPLDLSNISVCRVTNSDTTCSQVVNLAGTLADGDVHVMCHKDLTDKSNCDEESTLMTFNGDDRLLVFVDRGAPGAFDPMDTILDAFGQTSTQPSPSPWSDTGYRRKNCMAYDGQGAFTVTDFYDKVATVNDFTNLGSPPSITCP